MFENWQKGKSYSDGSQDYIRNNLLIHDNGWGTIQISVLHGYYEPDNEFVQASTMFATVDYFRKREKYPYRLSQLTNEQAFAMAIEMCNGIIASGIDIEAIKDHNP
jgi:hypothetical protein